jgi:hypothetical protein
LVLKVGHDRVMILLWVYVLNLLINVEK